MILPLWVYMPYSLEVVIFTPETSRIIGMAFGTVYTYTSITDEISYWYYNYGRLFIGAAGTSTGQQTGKDIVLFPASLSTVVAVTGLNANGGVCDVCHYGSKVLLAAYVDRAAPGAVGAGKPNVSTLTGSSNATGIIAGMAALVWSHHPEYSRSSVVSSLIYAASHYRSPLFGYGAPNGWCLVQGMCRLWVDGQTLIEETGTYTYTAYQKASGGPFSYQWSTGVCA
jgi:serine protease